MGTNINKSIETAEIVLFCADFDATFEFFTERLKFKIFSISPADNPSVAIVFGYGIRLRLEKTTKENESNQNIQINLNCNFLEEKTEIIAPNGVKIKFFNSDPPLVLPEFESKFVLNKCTAEADWIKGRADMRYRDLIPERFGGSVIASHIHIPKGGVVQDYVHFHKVCFQMIYCKKGWAKLVYEDQGEPFIFNSGDCVLQPPEIRHRVLESSDNLEVIEVSCPAEHETFADNEMTLPNSTVDVGRVFNGQRFIHHKSTKAIWKKWRIDGFECRNTGIDDATNNLASVKIVRPNSKIKPDIFQHNADFVFVFILQGNATFQRESKKKNLLNEGDSLVIPKNKKYMFSNCSEDLEIYEVTLPN